MTERPESFDKAMQLLTSGVRQKEIAIHLDVSRQRVHLRVLRGRQVLARRLLRPMLAEAA